MTLPPLYALRAFEAAARLRSFSEAAIQLNVTSGAISRHTRTLEAWFGCELSVRNGPCIEITLSGQGLAQQLAAGFQSLEHAYHAFRSSNHELRLKAPFTLATHWLLDVLDHFRGAHPVPVIEISSVWMDIDSVSFDREPYDCAILLGDGHFGNDTDSRLLFQRWLIPACSTALLVQAQRDLSVCELIHPPADRRDWRRWLQRAGKFPTLNLARGKVFDTLEQGSLAAMSGHGVSVTDLLLNLAAIRAGMLALPFKDAVATGKGYYLVWPKALTRLRNTELLYRWLKETASCVSSADLNWLD